MPEIPSTAADARDLLADYGHAPRMVKLAGWPTPVDHGYDPIDLDTGATGWWPPPFFGDWVSAGLAYGDGMPPVVYRLPVRALSMPTQVGMARQAERVATFRPLDRDHRARWGVMDWQGAHGVRVADPLGALITVLGDLDRLERTVGRIRSLANSADTDARAQLWRREAEEVAVFRAQHSRYVRPLAAAWLDTAPTPPARASVPPPMRPARLR